MPCVTAALLHGQGCSYAAVAPVNAVPLKCNFCNMLSTLFMLPQRALLHICASLLRAPVKLRFALCNSQLLCTRGRNFTINGLRRGDRTEEGPGATCCMCMLSSATAAQTLMSSCSRVGALMCFQILCRSQQRTFSKKEEKAKAS